MNPNDVMQAIRDADSLKDLGPVGSLIHANAPNWDAADRANVGQTFSGKYKSMMLAEAETQMVIYG